MNWTRSAAVLSCCGVLAMSSLGSTQTVQKSAGDWFTEGRNLMPDYKNARPKFAESFRLAPMSGTLLNLAECDENLGPLSLAWREYMEVALATRTTDDKSARYAQSKAQELEKRLPAHVLIQLAEPLKPDGVAVSLDGSPLSAGMLNIQLPMERAEHEVVADFGHDHPWKNKVDLRVSDFQSVTVPAYAPPPPPPLCEKPPCEPPLRCDNPQCKDATNPHAACPPNCIDTDNCNGTCKAVIGVAGGVGILGLMGGIGLGLVASSKKSDAEAICPGDRYCQTEDGVSRWHNAKQMGDLATIASIIGGVGVATATVVWLTHRSTPTQSVQVGAGLGTLQIRGSW